MKKNIAHQLVDYLAEAGVKRIYAVAGDSLNYLNDAIRKDGRIKWVHVRHEEAGAYAAAAEAELDGIACCAGSCGPGHIHLINGVYDAHRSHVPMIVIASTINTYEMGLDYFQGTNTYKLFDDCSCYNELITTAEQAPRIIQTAIQHAISLKGVAVIGFPGDIAEKEAKEGPNAKKFFYTKPRILPNKEELAITAEAINNGKNITIFCGIGAKDATEEVKKLASALKSPIGYSFRGKMSLQHDNPFDVGMTGLLGLPTAYHSLKESDLIILLGTDFPYDPFIPTKPTIIQIDSKPERLGRRCNLDIGLQGDIKDTLDALIPMINVRDDEHFLNRQLKMHQKMKEDNQSFIDHKGDINSIQPEFLVNTIDRLAKNDAIFTVDTGMTCVWGARFINNTRYRDLLGSFNHGSMANAMPMSIGAALSHPERQIIALCGDGGISMLLGDLATIKQYNLPIKIIIFNNRSLGMVKLEMEVAGLIDNETDMPNPDFALLAQAMGFPGRNVHDPNAVESAVTEAFEHDGPFLLNIFTNPNSLALPPKIEWNQVEGMAVSMSKLMLGGKMDEVWETIKANYKHIREI